ncbi:type II secretion system protein N [Rehaibacterium terrae]|jgi:general secretion pathway protein N|uniref:Type II secretion system protein N n=1 Tax=Rehaibacterium terrae TaxID=1341696 RepID=A0A7W8DES1_9GAMM|nr:type II secretion system protein N [Rehaibacterium terrae]MBB5015872.1 general secretion pathway protein N [Rehaibacterium terrae]
MRRAWWVAAFVLVFVAALLVFLPASVALRQVESRVPGLRFEEVSGTVWRGQAGRALIGMHDYGRLQWRVRPLALLRGILDVELDWQGGDRHARGRLAYGFGVLRADAVRAEFPATVLQRVLDTPALQPHGRVEVNVARAEFAGREPRLLEGDAVWRQAAVSGAARAALGGIHARFGLQPDGGIGGTLDDDGGPLAVAGDFRLDAGGYRAELLLDARDAAAAEALQWVGQPLPGGGRVLRLDGRWLEFPRRESR